jgi:hypothetical protein
VARQRLAGGGLVALYSLRRATPPVPQEAIGNVKADVDEVKERAHR